MSSVSRRTPRDFLAKERHSRLIIVDAPKLSFLRACAGVLILLGGAAASAVSPQPDLSKELTLYTIGYSHLDTQWRWTYPQVIREFIPNTIQENGALFAKYPHYIFNWSGANRYRLMQEYHPDGFARVSHWVAQGVGFRGNSWEECDVLAPSVESVIRQIIRQSLFQT